MQKMTAWKWWTVATAAVASAQRLSIEPCADGFAPEAFTVQPDGTVRTGGNQCVGYDSTSLLLQACSGAASQQWTFLADGTVQSKQDTANCWNVFGGSTGAGTAVVMYQCGTKGSSVAANDVFWPLPSSQHILANESGLCLSSSAPPFLCDGDACCSLNGHWDGAACTCYPPWTGANCSALSLQPVPPIQGYGMKPNVTSWGGNVLFDGANWHLYVAEMVNHCSLESWYTNSQCSHAVSSTIEGPYTFHDTAVGVWCHNPQVMVQTNASGTFYALFHIGDGTGGNPKNCSGEQQAVAVAGQGQVSPVRAPSAAGSTLHIATDPNGPWTPVSPPPPPCNNPAPFLHPNGTWFMVCNGFTLVSSPSLYGPWATVTQIHAVGKGVDGTYEDPFLWVDPRGNWHVIYHVYTTNVPDTCVNSTVSGHIFSTDGIHWSNTPLPPYDNHLDFTDGTSFTLPTRERPKLIFDATGTPTHIINGVTGGTTYCAPTPCVNCKYNSWDYTLVQPLGTV